MTKRALIAPVVIATALLAPSAQAKTPRCTSKAQTVAASETVRIFATGKGRLETRDLWACKRGSKTTATFVFDGASNETWSSIRIAADRYVSVVDRYESQLDGIVDISVYRADLKTRKNSAWRTPASETPADSDVALLDDGSAAVIDRQGTTSSTLYISRFPKAFTSDELTLDTGAAAQLTQLATRNSRLYWLNNGNARAVAPGSTAATTGPALAAPVGQFTTLSRKKGNTCENGKGITSISTPTARVYIAVKRKKKKNIGEDVFVCRRTGGPRTRIIRARDGDLYSNFAIAGRYLLYTTAKQPPSSESRLQNTTITIRDIATRGVVASLTDPALDVIPYTVLTSSGRYAYLRGTSLVIGGAAGQATFPALPTEPDLAASAATIYWIGADGLPHASG